MKLSKSGRYIEFRNGALISIVTIAFVIFVLVVFGVAAFM
jgi:hypothetical protein